jgi:nitrogen-specific signal transduction histidine kinase
MATDRQPMTEPESSKELQALLDAAVDGIVIIDHLGTILSFNQSAERLFGLRAAETLGCNVGILMAEQDRRGHDDNGPGIDAALAHRIFDPFCSTKPTGTGLGLPISRTIVHTHGGALDFKPNVPAGACFVVKLPATRTDEQ